MAVSRRQLVPDCLAKQTSPIQYVTENGFSIVRLCDVDKSVTDTPRECRFLVRNERGWKREVVVDFDVDLIKQIQGQRRTRLADSSVLWLVCAEQCLATYLWENDDYPEGGRFNIRELSVDQLLVATHWSDEQDD